MTASSLGSAPSCPCCAFVSGGGLFLPWIEGGGSKDDVGGTAPPADRPLSALVVAPGEAWDRILSARPRAGTDAGRRKILLVDTHGHPHLQREAQYARPEADDEMGLAVDGRVVSLTCAVSPSDWKDALEYASRSPRILPALGIHPWYLGDIMVVDDDIENPTENCGDGGCVMNCINWDWLTDLETHLSEHPRLLVGEIGLCRMARFVREFPKDRGGKASALELQKLVFSRQLELAARYSRPVTVHCVDAHGIFMEVLWEIFRNTKDPGSAGGGGGDEGEEGEEGEGSTKQQRRRRKAFPPAIAMHSFTGTAHHVDEIMSFERALLRLEGEGDAGGRRRRRIPNQRHRKEDPIDNPDDGQPSEDSSEREDVMFYFGFSHSVNHLMCTSEKARRRGTEVVRSVPSDRLLVESDVHTSIDVTLGTAGAVAYAAHVTGERIEDVAERCVVNGLRFLGALGSMTTSSS